MGKKWTVIWTFVANYGKMDVDAPTAEDAAKQVDSFAALERADRFLGKPPRE